MKIFKRNFKKVEKRKNNVFLKGLKNAIQYNKDKETYEKHFNSVLRKVDELNTIANENAKTPTNVLNWSKLITNEYEDNPFASNPLEIKKTCKFKLWFKKIKLKIKESWELMKEFGREIQYWAIAEYKIFTKLSYALNRKKDEVKVRKAFKNNKSMFINKHGYDKGTHLFNDFSASINNGVRLYKRLEKIGY